MRKLFFVFAVILVCPALMAQATRTWVSGVGDDVNPCSRTAPCKTFAGAISKTAAGGEINAIDPGGFGGVTITKSITIDGGGTFASILASTTTGVIVNALAADKIVLRNLSINGSLSAVSPGTPNGVRGINYLRAAQLTLDNVQIQGFNTAGIDANLATNGELILRNVFITECAIGVRLTTSLGQLLATLDNTSIINSTGIGLGVSATGSGATRVSVKRSTINHNNSDGVQATTANTQISLDDNMIGFNNGTAVNALVTGATIRLANNLITNNNIAFGLGGAAVLSSVGDNRVDGNGAQGATPTITFLLR
jgi:hypothetical protein